MDIDELRETYPFISYGDEYELWEKNDMWYKWLQQRILTEKPSESSVSNWKTASKNFKFLLSKRDAVFAKLPKPTDEQMARDDNDPFATGKWPEKRMSDIRVFAKIEDECRRMSREVAATIMESEYRMKVLGENVYAPTKGDKESGKIHSSILQSIR